LTLPGKRNESWSCAVYAFAALEDYAGFSKPNDMLERLAKELLSDEPKQKPRWGHSGETEPTVSNGSGSARRLGATVA